MGRLLPSSADATPRSDGDPRVIGLDSDDADDALAALSSATARRILAALHEEPDTPASIADGVDTTLQNVQYHLGRLQDAGLVEVVDTVYSEKGREMKVYAPADRPLVVFAGSDEEADGLRSALTRLVSAVAGLVLLSLLVQVALRGLPSLAAPGGAGGADGGGGDGGGAAEVAVQADEVATAAGLPPGLVFFLGGLAVIAVWAAVAYWRRR
jgi:DNA-binding transcriptional ArsR family regulator